MGYEGDDLDMLAPTIEEIEIAGWREYCINEEEVDDDDDGDDW